MRSFAVAIALSCLVSSASAQTQPAPGSSAKPAAAPPTALSVKKQAHKTKTTAKPPAAADNGPCRIGVIPAIGDQFVVQKVGLTVFGNEHTEVPIEAWGLDDLVVARVRAAAAAGTSVRRIAYPKGAFAPYDDPAPTLFRNPRDDLTAIVKQIATNARCERYVVVTKFTGQIENTNQTIRGIGVVNHGIGSLGLTYLSANIQVTVFDGQTFAVAKNPHTNLGAILAGAFAGLKRDDLAMLDNASFPDPATEAANSATLRDRTRALLTARLDKALPAFLNAE
jgi:hypothetical protein